MSCGRHFRRQLILDCTSHTRTLSHPAHTRSKDGGSFSAGEIPCVRYNCTHFVWTEARAGSKGIVAARTGMRKTYGVFLETEHMMVSGAVHKHCLRALRVLTFPWFLEVCGHVGVRGGGLVCAENTVWWGLAAVGNEHVGAVLVIQKLAQ